jgi:hypothetical protein
MFDVGYFPPNTPLEHAIPEITPFPFGWLSVPSVASFDHPKSGTWLPCGAGGGRWFFGCAPPLS